MMRPRAPLCVVGQIEENDGCGRDPLVSLDKQKKSRVAAAYPLVLLSKQRKGVVAAAYFPLISSLVNRIGG